jgi:hypothetical protein
MREEKRGIQPRREKYPLLLHKPEIMHSSFFSIYMMNMFVLLCLFFL